MPAQKTSVTRDLDPLRAERRNQGKAKVGLFEHASWLRSEAEK